MSAYRDASAGTSIIVPCAACGEEARVSEADALFRCSRCQLDQHVRRDDELAIPPMKVIEVVDGRIPYEQLRAFGRTVGVDRACIKIALACAGIRCAVNLELESEGDGAVGSSLGSRVAGLPEVTFRRESADDVHAKASGIAREVQTGDAAFDREVYIDSDAADRDLLTMLSSPAVRRAIQVLLRDFARLTVSATGIVSDSNRDETSAYDPAHIQRWLAALRVVAGAPRPATPTIVEVPNSYKIATRLAGASLLGFPLFIASIVAFEPVSGKPLLVFGSVGLLLAVASRPLLVRAIRGRAESHRTILLSWLGLILGVPLLVNAIGLFVNGASDRSPVRVRELRVTETSPGENNGQTHVHTVASDGSDFSDEFDFDDPNKRIRAGQTVFMKTKRGALGFEWSLRRAVLLLPDGTQIAQ